MLTKNGWANEKSENKTTMPKRIGSVLRLKFIKLDGNLV
jgi:hypothetical protein